MGDKKLKIRSVYALIGAAGCLALFFAITRTPAASGTEKLAAMPTVARSEQLDESPTPAKSLKPSSVGVVSPAVKTLNLALQQAAKEGDSPKAFLTRNSLDLQKDFTENIAAKTALTKELNAAKATSSSLMTLLFAAVIAIGFLVYTNTNQSQKLKAPTPKETPVPTGNPIPA